MGRLDEVLKLLEYDKEKGGLYRSFTYTTMKDSSGRSLSFMFGRRFGSSHPSGYRSGWFLGKNYREHQLVFLYHHGYIPKLIDHINRDKSDNRIDNLREADHTLNNLNKGLQKNNKSGYKGIHYNNLKRVWIVTVYHSKKTNYIGSFKTKKEAIEGMNGFIKSTSKIKA